LFFRLILPQRPQKASEHYYRYGVDYLGWHFYLTDISKVVKRLRMQNKKKLKRRMKGVQKGYAEGQLDWEDIKQHGGYSREFKPRTCLQAAEKAV